MTLDEATEAAQRAYLNRLLRKHGFCVPKVAREAGRDRRALYRVMNRLSVNYQRPRGNRTHGGNDWQAFASSMRAAA